VKAKKAIEGITRSRRPRQKRSPTPYEAVEHVASEEHPVDAAVEQRLPQRKLLRDIRVMSERMMVALGDTRRLWLRLEEVLGDYHLQREEAYFNIGYEYGLTAGRVEALQVLMPARKRGPSTERGRAFANRVRDLALQADLSPSLVIAAVLEAAWALALGIPQARSVGADRKP